MTDIIEHAEDLRQRYFLPEPYRITWDNLLIELKAARAEHKPSERDEYLSGLVEKLRGLAIDLNTIAYNMNKMTLDLSAEFPPIPGE
jgi:hypothetical protein